MGRPSTYTDAIFDEICTRLENGEVLRQICTDPELPDRSTVLRWIATDDGKRRKYDAARQACVDYWSDEIIQIATDGSKDTIVDEKGRARCDHEWVARSRLRIDTIKFLMTKINPLKWGDKLPEAAAARRLDIEAQAQIAASTSVQRIERVFLRPGEATQDANGDWVPSGVEALHARIAELEAELAGQAPQMKAPALLEYDPGPLPRRMDAEIARSLVELVKDHVRRDDQRPPEAVLDEVLTVCRQALRLHFGPSGDVFEMGAPA